jgi:hypothetical protein
LKCLYMVTRSLDPTGAGRAPWMMRWKPALNSFAITFVGGSTQLFTETAEPHTPMPGQTPTVPGSLPGGDGV